MVENQTGKRVKRLRTDNRTDEINAEVDRLCSKKGTLYELLCFFTPEQNGRIEREMRTSSEAVTTILVDSKISKMM